MKRLFIPNLEVKGRLARALMAAGLMAGAWFVFERCWWASLLLAAAGVFVFWEAWRGWCALRACGIKTKL